MAFREEVINVYFAELLREFGLDAQPESIIHHRKLPDIIINVGGVTVIIECRQAKAASSLFRDAKKRVLDGLADLAVALIYSEEIRMSETIQQLCANLRSAEYPVRMFYLNTQGIQEQCTQPLHIKDLSASISHAVELIRKDNMLDAMVSMVQDTLDDMSKLLAKEKCWFENSVLLNRLRDILAMKYDTKLRTNDLLRVALFVLFDGMIYHEHLSEGLPTVLPLTRASGPIKAFLLTEWRKILEIDFRPIFGLALSILDALPTTNPAVERALTTLVKTALSIVGTGLLRRHDFMGRIYHRLLLATTGDFYSTNYTAVASAYLLARLTLSRQQFGQLDDIGSLRELRLVDPACGSGTLLSAAYVVLRGLLAPQLSPCDYPQFHQTMVEEVLHGWDVLDYATHLSLTAIGLHSPCTTVGRSNIITLPNQVDHDQAALLGSLSLLDDALYLSAQGNWPLSLESLNESFDVVIMNPPYTRSAKPNCF